MRVAKEFIPTLSSPREKIDPGPHANPVLVQRNELICERVGTYSGGLFVYQYAYGALVCDYNTNKEMSKIYCSVEVSQYISR